MRKHLAIFSKGTISLIFSGKKTVETRFSQKKIPPFGVVGIGDTVYFKPPGEDVLGQFTVKKVISFEGLNDEDWSFIRLKWGKKLSLGSKEEDQLYFNSHNAAKYGTLIFMTNVEQFITSPIKFIKKDLRGWMVLD